MISLKGKKILAVLGYGEYFGAERANIQVLKMIRNAGGNVECIVLENGGSNFKVALQQEGFKLHAAKFGPSLFGLSWNLIHYSKNLIGMFYVSMKFLEIRKDIEPTHIYIPNYIQFLYVFPIFLFSRTQVIFRIGDPPENSILHKILWRNIISPHVKYFVANSKYTLSRLLANNVDACKGRIVSNCFTRKNFNYVYSENIQEKIIIYAGQINRLKGVDVAVDAAVTLCKKYKNIKFKFLGNYEYDTEYVRLLFDVIKKEKLKDRVIFLGFQEDIISHFKDSFLHICPSIQEESSANVVIEAKACGLPSIVFPRGGLPELINHKVDGYICKTADLLGLVDGIDYFLSDVKRIHNARVEARKSLSQFDEIEIQDKWAYLFT